MAGPAEALAGKYELVRRLAVGGMGEVYLARERGPRDFTRLVVVKRLLPQLARDPAFIEMFVDEARIVGHLHHPSICQILELGDDHGTPFLALEYVRGESVAEIWDRASQRGEAIPRAVTLRILADTAWALHAAHEACDADGKPLHVIHRDVSPHNVMVTFLGDVKLMDFGIARADNRQHRTDVGKVKGKISYMAPEQLRGDPLDRRADVFAIGVMLWELTLGRRLFSGGEIETLKLAIACDVPAPRSIDPLYPPALEAIVMRALAANRDDRTATAGELASALVGQVAVAGGTERGDIATVMQRLFPEGASDPNPSRPARPVRTASMPPEPVESVVVSPSRSGRARVLVIASAMLAAAAGIALYATRRSSPADDAPRTAIMAPADAAVARIDVVATVTPDAPIEATVEARIDATPPRTATPKQRAPAVLPAVTPVKPAPPIAEPAKGPPPTGALAVASARVGVVFVDGVRRKSTPFQTELAAGEHEIVLELAEGAGMLKARAHVEAGKKTKCRADDGKLACASP